MITIKDAKKENKKRVYADLYAWDGTITTQEIEEKNINDIVCAVEGQFFMAGNGITINGGDYRHVDIYYIEKEASNERN